MAKNTTEKVNVRPYTTYTTTANGAKRYIGVAYGKTRKHYNTSTKSYDSIGVMGCTLYGTKNANELHIQTSTSHLRAIESSVDGSIVLTYSVANTQGWAEADATYKTNMAEHRGEEGKAYLLNGLNFKTMKFKTLWNFYIEGLRDIYEKEHPVVATETAKN